MSDRIKAKIGEELYNQIIAAGLKSTDFDLVDGWIPKSRFKEVSDQKKELEGQVNTYKEKSTELDTLLKDNETLKDQYNALNTKYQNDLTAKENEIINISKRTKIEKALMDNGAMHSDLLMSKINLDDLKIDGENIIGLSDKITALKGEYKDLFKEVKTNTNNETKASDEPNKGQGEVNWDDVLKTF